MQTRPRMRGSWRVRQAATVVGAALVMVGAGLPWSRGQNDISPFHLSLKWLVGPRAGTDAEPVKSIGMLVLVIVGVIVFGLVTAGRSPTVLGALAAIAVPLGFALSVARSSRPLFDTLGYGVFVTILGGLVALVGTLAGAGPSRHHR